MNEIAESKTKQQKHHLYLMTSGVQKLIVITLTVVQNNKTETQRGQQNTHKTLLDCSFNRSERQPSVHANLSRYGTGSFGWVVALIPLSSCHIVINYYTQCLSLFSLLEDYM